MKAHKIKYEIRLVIEKTIAAEDENRAIQKTYQRACDVVNEIEKSDILEFDESITDCAVWDVIESSLYKPY